MQLASTAQHQDVSVLRYRTMVQLQLGRNRPLHRLDLHLCWQEQLGRGRRFVSLLNYSRETIKEGIGSWLCTAQRCKGVTEVHWGHKESQIKVNPNKGL